MKKQYFVHYNIQVEGRFIQSQNVTTVDCELGETADETLNNITNAIKPLYQYGVLILPTQIYLLN